MQMLHKVQKKLCLKIISNKKQYLASRKLIKMAQLNDLNNTRAKYYEVPQINEDHVLNYYLSELKNSIKI